MNVLTTLILCSKLPEKSGYHTEEAVSSNRSKVESKTIVTGIKKLLNYTTDGPEKSVRHLQPQPISTRTKCMPLTIQTTLTQPEIEMVCRKCSLCSGTTKIKIVDLVNLAQFLERIERNYNEIVY